MSIDLAKKTEVAKIILEKKNIFGEKAQVVVAEDISGSMLYDFSKGKVQELIARILGIGMNMDDNKEIDVYAFNTNGYEVGNANENNIDGYVNEVFLKKVSIGGGTNYSPVMKKIVDKFGTQKSGLSKLFGKKKTASKIPTLVFFITDGDNFDKAETIKLITETSNQPIFWQFIGIGNEQFNFLQKLDDLPNRFLDNADFFKVVDPTSATDEWFYDNILNEFPTWLSEAKSKGVL